MDPSTPYSSKWVTSGYKQGYIVHTVGAKRHIREYFGAHPQESGDSMHVDQNGHLESIEALAKSFGRNIEFNRQMYNDYNVLNTLKTQMDFIRGSVEWDICIKGKIAECTFTAKLPDGQIITGKEQACNKRDAKKNAARHLLAKMNPPSLPEMEQATKWIVSSHKSAIKANEHVILGPFGPQGHSIEIKWNVGGVEYRAQASGKTPKEAEMYAAQDLYIQTRSLGFGGDCNQTTTKARMTTTPIDKRDSTAFNGIQTNDDPSLYPMHEISKEDAGQMNTLRWQLYNKMKVDQNESVTECYGGFVCRLNWIWTDGNGTRHEKLVIKQASSKQMARALASKAMLIEIGAMDEVLPSQSHKAQEIRQVINNNINQALEDACHLIKCSNSSVWRLFLPQLWTKLIQVGNIALVERLLDAIVFCIKNNENGLNNNASDGIITNFQPQFLPTDLWEQMLSTASTCCTTHVDFGPMVLDKLNLVQLDPRYFFCRKSLEYYKLHSWLLALECQAAISQTVEGFRQSTTSYNDKMVPIKLQRVQLPLLYFQSDLTECSRNTIRKDEGIVLVLPLYHGQITTESWAHGIFAQVTKCKTEDYKSTICAKFITRYNGTLQSHTGSDWRHSSSESFVNDNWVDECLGGVDYGVIPVQPTVTFTRMLEALRLFTHATFPQATMSHTYTFTTEIRSLILGTRQLGETSLYCQLPTQMPLTCEQTRACISAMTMPLTLIQGPPGTGKTHVACAIIDCWHKMDSDERILAVSDSNVAADNLIEGLALRGISALRFGSGSESDIQEDAIRNLYRYENYKRLRENKMYKEAACLRACLFAEAMKRHKIIIATCVGSGNDALIAEEFPRVIIDECAQSIEATNLVAIGRKCKSLVLIGDHKQLRPTLHSMEASKRGLAVSMLERLANAKVAPLHLLNIQRRMHPSIAEFPNVHFYNGKISNEDVNDITRPQVLGFKWPCVGYNVAFIDASAGTPNQHFESASGTSRINDLEIRVIMAILKSILAAQDVNASEIGILTPYDSQRFRIKSHLESLSIASEKIEVDSVDGFQGKEKDLIIFSAVRSNREKQMGFLTDFRRMNVMLTRARRGLIVIGDQYTLLNDSSNWAPYLHWIHAKGLYIHLAQLEQHLKQHSGNFNSTSAIGANIAQDISAIKALIESAILPRLYSTRTGSPPA
ncbi:bifunctional DNA2-NAM7 helicase-like [Babesia duncani]|uniref:Bifunctional DNA2-NAM7 helicase-like n=1 Tax=Babesia duncani TaxID=323732 RepID=A0AAD9PJT1_9APIC|nr:bifunctional DNA2-NAM7 helicase-like [Babesia duncani]